MAVNGARTTLPVEGVSLTSIGSDLEVVDGDELALGDEHGLPDVRPGGDGEGHHLPPPGVSDDHLRYADLLAATSRAVLLATVAVFVAYCAGVLTPAVALDRLPQLWSLPVEEFVARAPLPQGWGWTSLLPAGDMLSLAGTGALAALSIPCLLALLPGYAARGERAYFLLVIAEVCVLVVAAAGWVSEAH